MAITLLCEHCGSSHHVNARLAGRSVRCPECDTPIQVPEASSPESAGSESAGSETSEHDAVQLEGPELDLGIDPAEFDDEPGIEEVFEDDLSLDIDPVGQLDANESDDASGLIEESDSNSTLSAASVASGGAPSSESTPAVSAPSAPVEDEDGDAIPKRKPRDDDELDMTPMVDVTFLLLIFFMVTASFSLQKSIEMPRQQTDAPSTNSDPEETDELESVEVQVDDRGSFLVLAADWEKETPGKQNLISALRSAMTNASDGMRLDITVHELAKLQSLVDAMDAGTIAGFTELQVTQVEDFD